jgi:hypothetical protein
MFENYDNITTTNKCNGANNCKSFNSPYEDYDEKGNLIGYKWAYGSTIDLDFNLSGQISFPSDSIIYKEANQTPTMQTVGEINSLAYNVVDLKKWQLKAIVNGEYIWQEESIYNTPNEGDLNCYITADDYLKHKKLIFKLFDNNLCKVDEKIYDAESSITYTINKELADKLTKGIYYFSLECYDPTTLETLSIIESTSLRLTIL